MFVNKLAKTQSAITNVAKRSHYYGGSKKYATGFERMVLDKFNAIPILPKLSWFSIFGIANLFCYGLSHVMSPRDYLYYFSYKGNGRLSDLVRSNLGSNNMINAAMTSSILIFSGQYLHSKLGALTMGKFTALSLLSIAAFQTAFGPNQAN